MTCPLFTRICSSQEIGKVDIKLLYEEMKKERLRMCEAMTAVTS
jgi:hypothetical protein